MNLPYLVFADVKGKIYHHPFLRMAGSSLDKAVPPAKEELIRLPQASSLFYLPGRLPVGFNPATARQELLRDFKGKKVFAVAAFPVPAYLRLYSPAVLIQEKSSLPLWAYTACGFKANAFYIAAKRVDPRLRQSPRFYRKDKVSKGVKSLLKEYPSNRLYRHLANCALNYNCLAAKNLFLNRWEAPLPTARACNARCIGCLSYQESDCVSSHQRISFRPSVKEVYEVMVNHLKSAKEAIVSFGQGCEGEPLSEAALIAESIYKVRQSISRGTINMNTNASVPAKIKELCRAGIDSFRVSLNSPDEGLYNAYFRPRNYKFKDVLSSIDTAKKHGKFVSVNLFVFPGLSDASSQIKSLVKFVKNTGVDMIQWRNLNIDPEIYLKTIACRKLRPEGVLNLLKAVKREFPRLKTGYFNLPKEDF